MIEISLVMFGNILFIILGVVVGLAAYSMRDWNVGLIGMPVFGYSVLALGCLLINNWLVII